MAIPNGNLTTECADAVSRFWTAGEIRKLGVITDVPTAGSIFGLSGDAAFELVRLGSFPVPVLRVGLRDLVPVASILSVLRLAPSIAGKDAASHRIGEMDDWQMGPTVNPRSVAELAPTNGGRVAEPEFPPSTFREYAERWRRTREAGWAHETRKRVPANLRDHLYPHFGDRPIVSITLTDVLDWLTRYLDSGRPKTSATLYLNVLKAVMHAAVIDRVIPDNPCDGVGLSGVLRGVTRRPRWIPTDDDVLRLIKAVPEVYRAAIWLGAAQGLRLGEVLGLEEAPRCIDPKRQQLHVVQQLRHTNSVAGGFVLTAPKAGSAGTVDLDAVVAEQIARHVRQYPPQAIEMLDNTGMEPEVRAVRLLFTNSRRRPLTDQRWSALWSGWRSDAGWPAQGTFHSLRHYFATTMISNGVAPEQVQHALRHANLRITLESYVHWIPRHDRTVGLVGEILSGSGGLR